MRILLNALLLSTALLPNAWAEDGFSILVSPTKDGKGVYCFFRKTLMEDTSLPVGYEGVRFKRRLQAGNKWSAVNKKPLYPTVIQDVSWENLDPDPKEQKRLKQKAESLLSKKDGIRKNIRDTECILMHFSEAKYMTMFKKNKTLGLVIAAAGMIVPKLQSGDLALIHNMGCVDRGIEPGKQYVYGLFTVYNGKDSKEPLAEHKFPLDTSKLEVKIKSFEPAPIMDQDGLKINFELNKNAEENGLTALTVYRGEGLTPQNWKLIGRSGLVSPDTDSYCLDRLNGFDKTKVYTYKVIPVQGIYELENMAATKVYDPAKKKVDEPEKLKRLPNPTIGTLDIDNDGATTIDWDYEWPEGYTPLGFQVYRRHIHVSVDMELLTANPLPPGERGWVDNSPKLLGHLYGYTVRALTKPEKDGGWSKEKSAFYRPQSKVSNLKVERIVENGQVYLLATWDKPSPKLAKQIHGYYVAIGRNGGPLAPQASIMPFKENHFKYRVSSNKETTYTVGILTDAIWGGKAEYATASVFVRSTRLARPEELKIRPDSPNKVFAKLEWTYTATEHLAGFRLYGYQLSPERTKTKLLMDVSELPADSREVRLGPHKPGHSYSYYLQAVDIEGFMSERSLGGLYEYYPSIDLKKGFQEIRVSPENLQASVQDQVDGSQMIHLSWDFDPQYADLVDGYRISADFADALKMPEGLVKGTTVSIPLNNDFSGTMILGVSPVHFQGKEFEAVTTSVDISRKQAPVKAITPSSAVSQERPRTWIGFGIAFVLILAAMVFLKIRRSK